MDSIHKISISGLGYVGLNLAVALAKIYTVFGYDINEQRVSQLLEHHDVNGDFKTAALAEHKINFTTNIDDLRQTSIHIIAAPTLLTSEGTPDLTPLLSATKSIASILTKGDLVIYESSVYPGVTEDECIPLLEQISAMVCGQDFGVAYSPERINPGDKKHTFKNITKIIAATDDKTLDQVANIYTQALDTKIYRAPCIKVAEAAKLMENIQRDVNIALVNYYAQIMHKLNLNFTDVFNAMQTKWNALHFKPGFVGGHCIGINAQYLAFLANHLNIDSTLITSERNINSSMPHYITAEILRLIESQGIKIAQARIAILGVTYKEDYPDLQDSPTIILVNTLVKTGATVLISDPIADNKLVEKKYNMPLTDIDNINSMDLIAVTTAHRQYHNAEAQISAMLNTHGIIVDIKGIFDPKRVNASKVYLWQI